MQKMENSRNIEKQRMVLTDFIKCRHDKNNLLYLKSGDHVLKVSQLHKVLIESKRINRYTTWFLFDTN